MSSRRLPGDLLKTSLRRLKTSSRLFLVNAKDHLETIHGLSIYVSFKLFTYYHSITRQTNWINLNKLNTLKLENNVEVMKTWFSIHCQTKKHFFQEFKYFLASEFCIQYTRFYFISNLGFCLELRLLNSDTEIGTGVA